MHSESKKLTPLKSAAIFLLLSAELFLTYSISTKIFFFMRSRETVKANGMSDEFKKGGTAIEQ
jgi:hypothetical protein